MKVFLGADHGGYELKNKVRDHLKEKGYEVHDEGALTHDPDDDDVTYAYAVGLKMIGEEEPSFGVLLCRSGAEMAMTANRMTGMRAAVAWNVEVAKAAREHNDANIVCIPSDYIEGDSALEIIDAFLNEPFAKKERYIRRIKMLDELG